MCREAAHLVVVGSGQEAQRGARDEQDDVVLQRDARLAKLLPRGPAGVKGFEGLAV